MSGIFKSYEMASPLKATPERASSSTAGSENPPSSQPIQDRFIPDRQSQNHEMSLFFLTAKENGMPSPLRHDSQNLAGAEEPYTSCLARVLFPETTQNTILGLQASPNVDLVRNPELNRFAHSLGVVYSENKARNFHSRAFRVIPQTPERILDAPELIDDFYLNLVDWSCKNILTVALAQSVYLWNADNGDIQQLTTTEDRENVITSVAWHVDGDMLAIGTNESEVQLWDTREQKQLRSLGGHHSRVGSLSWSPHVLATGSRDATIRLYDLRTPQTVGVLNNGHTQEVCGLRWSLASGLLASGGNDNVLNVWDIRRNSLDCRPMLNLRQHVAAIKALAWNPLYPNLLVSGGGTADKTIRFWNTSTGDCLHVINTESQVCGALWSLSGQELITSHGYSDNQLSIWKYPSLSHMTDLTGHTSRVLHLALSPDGQTVVSAAGDETIRFWRCFGGDASPKKRKIPSLTAKDDTFTLPMR